MREYRKILNDALSKKELLENQVAVVKKEKEEKQEHFEKVLVPAQELLQETAQKTQTMICMHIQNIVQMALDAVFPDRGYEFKVSFEIKRGRTEARMFLLEDGAELNPMFANGGGVVDILANAIRVSAFTLSNNRAFLFLDEPMRFVSADLQETAADILREISHKVGLQLIVVTHSEQIINVADSVFRTTIKKGKTQVCKRS